MDEGTKGTGVQRIGPWPLLGVQAVAGWFGSRLEDLDPVPGV